MGPSIEETLEKALFQIYHTPFKLQAASRTDAGVHAAGQVVNLLFPEPLDLYRLHRSLNGILPPSISIHSLKVVPLEFHPTLDAQGKEYQYQVCNGPVQLPFYRCFSWHFPYSLDLSLMLKAADQLIGTHDFSAFSNLKTDNSIRTLTSITINQLPHRRLLISIIGNNFLYKMVRNIVGTLLYIGSGKLSPHIIPHLLKSLDRAQAGVTAPALGLTLKNVFYPP